MIEDIRLRCKTAVNTSLAIFYFSFSDNRKQSFESLLCSLVAQFGWKEPGRSMLQREYDKPNRSLPGPAALEEILVSSISQYEEEKLKSTKPKFVRATLISLPATLDETYERMLTGVEEILREEALILLRWLVYARSPPSLGELAEATIIDLKYAGSVNFDDRGNIEDTLEILSGLVTLEGVERNDKDNDIGEDKDLVPEVSEQKDIGSRITFPIRRVGKDTTVRLAHFSVEEYLKSDRILLSKAKDFYLENAKEQGFLAQGCLTYLVHYSSSNDKSSTMDDLVAFPLLRYAARSWFYHSSFQESANVGREVNLLNTETTKLDWLLVHQPDMTLENPFENLEEVGSSVYYASFVGLEKVVGVLLARGAAINAQGGYYGNALQAASLRGHEKVVIMLSKKGAYSQSLGDLQPSD